ncbi:uncharacterized protein LOC100922944 isoform X2 [Sarcophilus harrisii]|uniref:uncharacterized protein LOC100922944 isoform X2 n=1 Tax=Sarcophilus harrisii TaxID=9305 RepID=UPI000226F1E1|nr:uncharacterized protein LOC100922944 isoform X2 [Sarcophilus harrisii]
MKTMIRFPMKIGIIFLFFFMESLLYMSIYSAPVNSCDPAKRIIIRSLDMDDKGHKVQHKSVPNSINADSTNLDMYNEEAYTESNEFLMDRSPEKKGINWDEEVISLGCLSFLFALTGGAALWLTIYTHLKREETRELDNLAEKLMPLKTSKKTEKPKEPVAKPREKEREFKSLLHAVLKNDRKQRRRRKCMRPNSRLNLTRRKLFARKKRSQNLEVHKQDSKIPKMNQPIGGFQGTFEKENPNRKKMQAGEMKERVMESPHLADQTPTKMPSFPKSNMK